MSDTKKSDLLDSLTDLAKSTLDVARAGAEELAERTKAVAHDLAAKLGDEEGNAQDRAKAAEARARADAHRHEYTEDMRDLDDKFKDATKDVREKASDVMDRAKAQASEMVDRARQEGRQVADKVDDTAKDVRDDLKS